MNSQEGLDKVSKESEEFEEVNPPVYLPLCDIFGYACMTVWMFAVVWSSGSMMLEGHNETNNASVFHLCFFVGVFLAALCFFCLKIPVPLDARNQRKGAIAALMMCEQLLIFYFFEPSFVVSVVSWICAGTGHLTMYFFWGVRLRILSRRQQLYTLCGAFAIGGILLSLFSFVSFALVVSTVVVLPLASFVLLHFSYQHSNTQEGANIKLLDMDSVRGIRTLWLKIPFKEDKTAIFLKGLFVCFYSITFGFIACVTFSRPLYPANGLIVGFSNIVASLAMLALLHGKESYPVKYIPVLFFPVTSVSYLIYILLWPSEGVFFASFFVFLLFCCHEIMNVRTPCYSSYGTVRYLFELYSSKMASATGFLCGWTIATAILLAFEAGSTLIPTLCLLLISILSVVDSLLFKRMRPEFFDGDADVVSDGFSASTEKLSAELESLSLQPRGAWSLACDALADRYKFSPRQREIFIYLSKGRNLQFIKDNLVLSTPTVKSHIYNIYQKMSIHSHQELIDIVEIEVKAVREGI